MTPEQIALFARIEDKHWWFVGRRQIIGRIIHKIVPPGAGQTIIDVGCGTGGNLASLAADYRCIGIDTTADAIAFARQRFPNVEYIHGEFPLGLGSALAQASLITCMDVIERIEYERPFVEKLVDSLSPG